MRAIDDDRRTVTVALDGGQRVDLDAAYLEPGHLDHGYALTAHRAQGMTVDRSFVLGSEELYREWGYTALSRHREEARFYVARGDLDLERHRDAPPPLDPELAGLKRLLERSHAKDLALEHLDSEPAQPDENLTSRDTSELAHERDQLRERVDLKTLPPGDLDRLSNEADQAHTSLQDTLQRIESLRARRDSTSILRRRERRELRDLIATHERTVGRQYERWDVARETFNAAQDCADAWLQEHGPAGTRLLAIERELAQRDAAGATARDRVDALDRRPDWPTAQNLELDFARDVGLDVGP